MSLFRTCLVLLCLVLSWFGIAGTVAADEIEHPFQFSLGGFWNEVDATVASTPNGFDKVELDLDRLGLDDRATIFWSEGTWRFTERWSANLSYSQFSSDGLAEATADGVYEDIEWEAGAALATDFGIGLAIANITWDFVSTDRTRAGIGLGVHTANLEFDITASARIETSEGVFEEVVETTGNDLLAPLPNVALTASHEFTDNLRLLGYLGYFSLSYDDYDGTLVSTRVALEWFPWENVGFGGALQYVDVELEIEQSRRVDDYEVALFGPIAYATFRF